MNYMDREEVREALRRAYQKNTLSWAHAHKLEREETVKKTFAFEQRMDEICLIYADLFGVSVEQAEERLK